jgi:CspA family cold shock protein
VTELARGRGLTGRVEHFDADVGLGEIVADSGERYAFHCIEIADGTREIPVGVEVAFDLLPKFGRYEAADIRR